MSARTATIETLLAALARFVRDDRCRTLQILVDVELRKSVIELVLAQEHRPDARAPFVLFEHEHALADRGWAARAAFARKQHARRREGAEPTVAALGDAPTGDERTVFALQLGQLLLAAPQHSEGLVAVLAPTRIEGAAGFREAVEWFSARRELAAVRWIVIEVDGDALGPTIAAAGDRAQRVDMRLPAGANDAELDALVADRPPAGPRGVAPPVRPDVPDRTPDADGQRRREVGRLSLAAAVAASRGQASAAVTAQRSARDLCTQAGWTGEALTMELALGGHLVGAGATREAEISFLRAIEVAKQHEMHDRAATAGFGLAATRTIRGERHTALVAYAEAAVAAEKSGSPVLAIEASRLAGQAALELRMEPQAITFLAKAVQLAEDASEHAARSSAAVAARTLAALCKKRGLTERAAALGAQADALARTAPPGAAAVTVPPVSAPSPIVVASAQAPLPQAALAPAVTPVTPPPLAASGAAFVPFDEGTSMLTLEQIARVHLRGTSTDATPPEHGARSWTPGEIVALQRAVDHSLGDDASRILSREELTALRGEAVVAEPQAAASPVPPPLLPPAEQLG